MADKLYSFDEIKVQGDCLQFVRDVLGLEVKHGRCAATWRGGENDQSVSIERDKFYDHGAKKGGSIIDLCAVSKFNGDIFAATSFLGNWLHLPPMDSFRENTKLAATYQYKDRNGAVVHETLRLLREDGSKIMRQRRPDPANPGKYIYNLDGITTILYRLSEWVDKPKVVIVEGEKCADALAALGLPVTTNAMGAGKWREAYNALFSGKAVAVIADNDDAGILHARHIADSLTPVAKVVKLIQLPGLERGEDVYEYLHKYKHTKDELLAAINEAPAHSILHLQAPAQEQLATASEANERPFSNYILRKIAGADGDNKAKPQPISITDLCSDVRRRMFNFPHRIGDLLFDHDRRSNRLVFLRDVNALFSWISTKSGANYKWKHGEGCVTREELFSALYASSKPFNMISGVPHYPLRDDVYYTYGELPPATKGRLSGFLDLFSFATDEDRLLYTVFLATLIYYRPKIDRPIWVFDSDDGQGSGKTKAAEYAALLVGGDDPDCGEPLWVDWKQLESEQALGTIIKRLLSASGRKKRMLLLDNVEGYFRSPALATLVTQGSISGMAPYGHGEETRPNDLVYVVTCNSATLSRDIISRSMIIRMAKPHATSKRWNSQVEEYITRYRMEMVAEIVDTLKAGMLYDMVPATRFATWEMDVMAPMLVDQDTISSVWKHSEYCKLESDADAEEAEVINDVLEHKVGEYVQNQDAKTVFVQSSLLSEWCIEAIPGFGGRDGRNVKTKLRNLVKVGLIPRLQFGKGDAARCKRIRGAYWTGKDASPTDNPIVLKKLQSGAVDILY